MTLTTTLRSLPARACGVIEAVEEIGTFAKRLADMGFVRGAEVMMIRAGSPCIVSIAGRLVGLGAAGQAHIRVRTI